MLTASHAVEVIQINAHHALAVSIYQMEVVFAQVHIISTEQHADHVMLTA